MARKATAKTPTQKSENELLDSVFDRISANKRAEASLEDDEEVAAQAAPQTADKSKSKKTPKIATSEEPDTVARTGKKLKTASVTYHPGNDDKPYCIWHGIKFDANVPRIVANQELIESAKLNPWFSVDGKRAAKHKKPLPPDQEEMSYEHRAGSATMQDGRGKPEEVEVEADEEHFADA